MDQNGIGVIPLHKGNIEEIRIQYNDVRDLFKININTESNFVINLNARINNYEIIEFENISFLDVYCIDRDIFEGIRRLDQDDKKGILEYYRSIYKNEIIERILNIDKKEES